MSCLSAVMSCLSAVMSCLSAVMSCLSSAMSYISSVPWCTPLGRHCCRLGFAVIIFISQCVYFYFFYHPYSSNGCLTVYSINTFQVCCMHLSDNLLSVCLIVLTWWLCVASIVEGCSRSALVSKCYICCFYFCVGDPLPWVFPVCVLQPSDCPTVMDILLLMYCTYLHIYRQ